MIIQIRILKIIPVKLPFQVVEQMAELKLKGYRKQCATKARTGALHPVCALY